MSVVMIALGCGARIELQEDDMARGGSSMRATSGGRSGSGATAGTGQVLPQVGGTSTAYPVPSDTGGQPADVEAAGGALSAGGGAPAGDLVCELQSLEVMASDLSETDGCVADYACEGGGHLVIDCDGENDGTNTSLCTCRYGAINRDAGDVVAGEAPDSCKNALVKCVGQLGM